MVSQPITLPTPDLPASPIITMPKQFVGGHKTVVAKPGQASSAKPRYGLILILISVVLLLLASLAVTAWLFKPQLGKVLGLVGLTSPEPIMVDPVVNPGVQPGEQTAATDQDQGPGEQPQGEEATTRSLEALVRDQSGQIVAMATLILPSSQELLTITGQPVHNDRPGAVGGEFVLSSDVILTEPASLSIALAPEVWEQVASQEPTLGVWDEKVGQWDLLDAGLVNKEQATITIQLANLVSAPYAVVPKKVNELPAGSDQPSEVKPIKLQMTQDSDSDDLTDLEEFLYQTDPLQADSDNDNYSDGREVKNLYSPRVGGEARLVSDSRIAIYVNPNFLYSLLYPASWVTAALDEQTHREVIITSATGEFIELRLEDNKKNLDLLIWLEKEVEPADVKDVEMVMQSEKLQILRAANGRIYYAQLTGADYILVLTYDQGTKPQANFVTTFEMIARSLQKPEVGDQRSDISGQL